MRLGTIAGRLALVSGDQALDVNVASSGRLSHDPLIALGHLADMRAWAAAADWSGAVTFRPEELGPPVPRPRQVFAVALNYRPHAAEAGFTPPAQPLIFTKFPSCITGPVAAVSLPEGHVDWEVEIVAVVGAGGRNIDRADAWDVLAGLTVGQDLSERIIQLQGSAPQFSLGKSYAGFGPIGPVLVTPDEFTDRDDIEFFSSLDGEELQHGRTSEMIFAVDDLVAYLSRVCELYPGDLIFTGTPSGVGNRRTPPRFLRAGETLRSAAAGIGEIVQVFG